MHLKDVLPLINRLFTQGTLAGQSDAGLLRRFCTGGDEAAFGLPRRGTDRWSSRCAARAARRIRRGRRLSSRLPDPRPPCRSIVVDESLGGWLHQVAYRVARRANAEAARRRSRERTCVACSMRPRRTGTACVLRFACALTRRSPGCPSRSARSWCSACSRARRRQRRPPKSVAARPPSGAAWPGSASGSGGGSALCDTGLMVPPALPAVPAHWVAATTRIAAGPVTALARPVLAAMTLAHLVRVAAILLAFGLGTAGTVGANPGCRVRLRPRTRRQGNLAGRGHRARARARAGSGGRGRTRGGGCRPRTCDRARRQARGGVHRLPLRLRHRARSTEGDDQTPPRAASDSPPRACWAKQT